MERSELMISALYDLSHTISAELFKKAVYPWEVLPLIHGFILEMGPKLSEDYIQVSEHVWIEKHAKIAKSASITGPVIICANAEIRHSAFIRGNAIIGEGAVVGNSTELKNVVLFDRVQVPHYNYVGDSILGYKAHMGAGAITSNVKSDKTFIKIKTAEGIIETGLKKVGGILGDYVEVGCGCVLNPGTIIGKNSNIYPLSSVRGCVPSNHIYKNPDEIILKV